MPVFEDEPSQNLVDRAADAAFRTIEDLVEAEGGKVATILIVLRLEGEQPDEIDSTVAGQGFENSLAVFAELIGHTVGAGKQLGLKVVVAPIARPGRG